MLTRMKLKFAYRESWGVLWVWRYWSSRSNSSCHLLFSLTWSFCFCSLPCHTGGHFQARLTAGFWVKSITDRLAGDCSVSRKGHQNKFLPPWVLSSRHNFCPVILALSSGPRCFSPSTVMTLVSSNSSYLAFWCYTARSPNTFTN